MIVVGVVVVVLRVGIGEICLKYGNEICLLPAPESLPTFNKMFCDSGFGVSCLSDTRLSARKKYADRIRVTRVSNRTQHTTPVTKSVHGFCY